MAAGFTDFSGNTTGEFPVDWTPRWEGEEAGATVIEGVSGATGGKVLHILSDGALKLRGFSFNPADAHADRANFEVWIRFQLNSSASNQFLHAFGRGSGASISNAYLYSGAVNRNSNRKNLNKRVNGSLTTIQFSSETINNGVWREMRVRGNGNTIQARHWLSAEAEPETWDFSATDNAISAAGWLGVMSGAFSSGGQVDDVYIDAFGYGTGGDAAPRSAVSDETAPTLTSPSGAQTGATTADLSVSTDEGNGTLYWVVTESSTSPSVAQVQDGEDHTGAAGADSGSQAVSTTGTQTAGATGLTAETTYYAHFQNTDAASNDSTVVTSASFTTAAVPLDPPQGTVSISDVTPGVTTAEVAYTYDDSDQTGFEYRINEGTPAAIGASPATITGLTAATDYDTPGLQVRAVNAQGAGAWSAAFPFSTQSEPPAEVKGVSVQLYDGSTEQASITGIHALWWDSADPAGAPVFETTTASTDAAGILTLDLDAVTTLELSGTGFLLLWKPETVTQDSPAFAGRLPVVDIS